MRDYAAAWPWLIVLGGLGILIIPSGKSEHEQPANHPPPAEDVGKGPAGAKVTGPETPPGPTSQDALQPFFAFLGKEPASAAGDERLRQLEKDLQNKNKREFLIALVPDPSTSRFASMFDAYLEAIQRALEREKYLLDRVWLPWKPRTTVKKEEKPDQLAEREPGILLFRKKEKAGPPSLLAVFLVGETPTAGLQKTAFVKAIDYTVALTPPERQELPLNIVGPTFSGSADSLRAALRAAKEKSIIKDGMAIRIISGSAMGIKPKDFANELQSVVFPQENTGTVDYRTTVIQTSDLVKVIKEATRKAPGKVAVLKESNTAYGQAAVRKEEKQDNGKQDKKETEVWIEIPFPLHISRTLAAISKDPARSGEARGLPTTRKNLPFPDDPLEDPGLPTGPMAPATTDVLNEMTLADILSTISREDIRYVGLHATDTRDKMFLASMVREHCPDVRLFLLSSNLLLAHPEYAFAMRGAMVASTYPLHPSLPHWSEPYDGHKQRLLFTQQGAQGTYNAVLALRNRPEDMIGFAIPRTYAESHRPSNSEEEMTRPPVWLSVVSPTGRLVPLNFVPLESVEDADLEGLVERKADNKAHPEAVLDYNSIWLSGMILLSMGCACLFWSASRVKARAGEFPASSLPLARLFWPSSPPATRPAADASRVLFSAMALWKQALSLACCLIPLALLYGLLTRYALIPVVVNLPRQIDDMKWWLLLPAGFCLAGIVAVVRWFYRGRPASLLVIPILAVILAGMVPPGGIKWQVLPWGLLVVAIFVLLGLLYWLWQLPLRGGPAHSAAGPADMVFQWGFPAVASALGLIFTVALVWHAVTMSAHDVLDFERGIDLSSGLSPLLSAFFLAMAIFSWGYFQLKRAYLLDLYSVPNPFSSPTSPPGASASQERPGPQNEKVSLFATLGKLHQEIDESLASLPADGEHRWMPRWKAHLRSYGVVYVLVALALVHLWRRALPTFEGPWFDAVLFAGFALATLGLGLTFAHFLHLWRRVGRMLRRLSLMPLDRAFNNLPKDVASMFRGYLYTLRPRRSHFAVPIRQYTRLRALSTPEVLNRLGEFLAQDQSALETLKKAFTPDLAGQFEEELRRTAEAVSEVEEVTSGTVAVPRGSPEAGPGDSVESLRIATAASLQVLEKIWQKCPPEEVSRASDVPDAPPARADAPRDDRLGPAREWIRLTENFVATQAVLYVSQFFVHLRNLLMSVTVGALLLLMAVTSYPFHPQNLLVVYLLVGVGIVTVGTVAVFIQINRNSFVSHLLSTPAERFTPDLGFFRSIATYVLPLLGVLAVQLSGTLRLWLEPIFRLAH